MANPPDPNHVFPTSTLPPVPPMGFTQMPLQPHHHGQTILSIAQRPTDAHYDRMPLMQTAQEQRKILLIQQQVMARRRHSERVQTARRKYQQHRIHRRNQMNFRRQHQNPIVPFARNPHHPVNVLSPLSQPDQNIQHQNAPGSGIPPQSNSFPVYQWPPVPLTPQPVQNSQLPVQPQNQFLQSHPNIHQNNPFQSLRQYYAKHKQMPQASLLVYMYFYHCQLLGIEKKDSITEFIDQLRKLLPELPEQFYTELTQKIEKATNVHPTQPK